MDLILPVTIMIFDPDAQVTYDCTDLSVLPLAGQALCVVYDPGFLVIPASSPIGWQETGVTATSITMSCGYYRAQDGHRACTQAFPGDRYVKYLWVYYCRCGDNDHQYRTSGHEKNYATGSRADMGTFATFLDNRQVGGSHGACNGQWMRWRYASGITGTMQDSSHASCMVREAQINGVWGAGVEYRRDTMGGDDHLTNHHEYLYTYEG